VAAEFLAPFRKHSIEACGVTPDPDAAMQYGDVTETGYIEASSKFFSCMKIFMVLFQQAVTAPFFKRADCQIAM